MAEYKLTNNQTIIRMLDGAVIPPDTTNTDYQKYLVWLDESNTPDPAQQPSTNETLITKIQLIETKVTERRIREAILGIDDGWLEAINEQITALRAQLEET